MYSQSVDLRVPSVRKALTNSNEVPRLERGYVIVMNAKDLCEANRRPWQRAEWPGHDT
jgi:hypothetical protein